MALISVEAWIDRHGDLSAVGSVESKAAGELASPLVSVVIREISPQRGSVARRALDRLRSMTSQYRLAWLQRVARRSGSFTA
ncbi:MAG: hypothetical protein M3Z29_09995 [Pseudomonadota bacterium]|nr:hypothetical protein [Pseudomonadota bacterium]